jgi:hypothetical protein
LLHSGLPCSLIAHFLLILNLAEHLPCDFLPSFHSSLHSSSFTHLTLSCYFLFILDPRGRPSSVLFWLNLKIDIPDFLRSLFLSYRSILQLSAWSNSLWLFDEKKPSLRNITYPSTTQHIVLLRVLSRTIGWVQVSTTYEAGHHMFWISKLTPKVKSRRQHIRG